MLDGVAPCGRGHLRRTAHAVGCSAADARARGHADDDLMFRPAIELAAMVRAGEISARELVRELAGADRGAQPRARTRSSRSTPSGRSRPPTRSRPATSARSRASRSAIKNNRAGAGPAPDLRLRADGATTSRPTTTTSTRRLKRRRLRDRRHDDAARVRDPARDRGARLRPDAQPVGPRAHAGRLLRRRGGGRRQPAWCRSRTATTAAARSASRPPAAASSG